MVILSLSLSNSLYNWNLLVRILTSTLVQFSQLNCLESYIMTDGQSASLSWNKSPIWGLRPDFYYCQLRVCWCGAHFLTRGRVCYLQLLLALASAVILGSKVRGTRGHIVLDSSLPFSSPPTTRMATVEVRIRPRLHTLATSGLSLYNRRTDQRTEDAASPIVQWRFYWVYHVIAIQPVDWRPDCLATSCNIRPLRTQLPLVHVGTCLRSRCLEIMYCHALKRGVYRAVAYLYTLQYLIFHNGVIVFLNPVRPDNSLYEYTLGIRSTWTNIKVILVEESV
jgi:hypothetical protein